MSLSLIEATTDSDVAAISQNGVTETTTLSGNVTFAQVYQDAQWWAHQEANMQYLIPAISTGGGAYVAAFDITTTGYTLNGSGSISMGSNTFTATGYTYTGGTFSQATTSPAFSGGTLTLSTAGTYSYGFGGTMSLSLTAAGDYHLEAGTFDATTITVNNPNNVAITVYIPAGATVVKGTNAGNTTLSAPVVTRGLDFAFTGGTTSRVVKVFDTGTQDVVATLSSPDYIWSEQASGTRLLDYTVLEDGYLPIRAVGVEVMGRETGGVQAVSVTQTIDRAFTTPSGLTFGTNLFYNPTTKLGGLTVASTLQNLYSQLIVSYRTEATLQNKPFPMAANGPNSFSWLDGNTFNLDAYPNSITLLSRDGMQYLDTSGVATDIWAAILSVGVPAGLQVR
jgi:hypothetical protein